MFDSSAMYGRRTRYYVPPVVTYKDSRAAFFSKVASASAGGFPKRGRRCIREEEFAEGDGVRVPLSLRAARKGG